MNVIDLIAINAYDMQTRNNMLVNKINEIIRYLKVDKFHECKNDPLNNWTQNGVLSFKTPIGEDGSIVEAATTTKTEFEPDNIYNTGTQTETWGKSHRNLQSIGVCGSTATIESDDSFVQSYNKGVTEIAKVATTHNLKIDLANLELEYERKDNSIGEHWDEWRTNIYIPNRKGIIAKIDELEKIFKKSEVKYE